MAPSADPPLQSVLPPAEETPRLVPRRPDGDAGTA